MMKAQDLAYFTEITAVGIVRLDPVPKEFPSFLLCWYSTQHS